VLGLYQQHYVDIVLMCTFYKAKYGDAAPSTEVI